MAPAPTVSSVTETPPRLVVFAIGNPSRGDDALGPALLRSLESALPAGTRVVDDFQLQVEHALDMQDADLVLFLDAACAQREPLRFIRLDPDPSATVFSHALAPAQLLAVFERVLGHPPPPAFVLAMRAESFDLGAPLSPLGQHTLNQARTLLSRLLIAPDVGGWASEVDMLSIQAG